MADYPGEILKQMLSPRYLDGLSDEIIEIYSQLETDILQDMARRLARIGKVTDATKWQAQMLAEAGGLKKKIGRILAKYDKAIVRQIKDTFTEALETNARNDNRIFKEATGRTISAPNAQAMLSTIQKCHSDLSRLTLTTATTTQTQFVREANRVYMMTQSGAFDYDTAMKDAADELAKRGITTVQYENGRPVTRSIESAVRMNILTSINQTAANQTLNNAEELGVEKFEVTAHVGARPEHEAWQGKIYTRTQLETVCGLGDVTGLCGINCKHSFYPYFDGMEEHYTQADLDEMADEKVSYNGRDMTRYEAEQRERQIERNIRHYKRQALTQEAAGADSTKARRKIGEWQAAARDFTRQTGIARDSAREYIGTGGKAQEYVGTKASTQPRALMGDYYETKRYEKHATQTFNPANNYLSNVEQGAPMTFEKADSGNVNPRFRTTKGYSENCQSAVVTFEARLRGFDVEVLPNVQGSKLETLSNETQLAWKTKDGKTPEYIFDTKANTIDKMLDFVDRTIKPNERYTLRGRYKNKDYGHIINVFREADGKLVYYDPQSNEILDDFGRNQFYMMMNKGRTPQTAMKLLRVDNLEFNKDIVDYILTRRNRAWKKP